MEIAQWCQEMKHVSGKDNTVADWLSRPTPLLSEGAEKKNFPNTLMVAPNSLGQMLKFGTSYGKK